MMTRDPAFRTANGRDAGRDALGPRRSTRERLPRRAHAARRPNAPPRASGGQGAGASPHVSPQQAARHLPAQRPAPLCEAALFYDPPYASPLADRLAQHLVQHLKPSCGLQHEAVALTPRNCFRLDFLIETDQTHPGIERAGILLGERPEAEDAPALYDALIVGSGAVDVLYRFDPDGLDAHLSDALFLMGAHAPALFAHPERLEASQGPCAGALRGPAVRLSYPTPPVDVQPGRLPERPATPPDLTVRRLSAAAPAAWEADYRRALEHFRIPESQHRPPEALRRRAKAA